MMPKIQASHTGSYLLVVIALLGAFVCNLSYAQVNPFGLEGEIELWTEEEIPVIEILRLRDFRATPTLATDGPADVDVPLVSLTWTNPPEELVELETAGQSLYQLTLYKSTAGFPTGPLDGTRIALDSHTEAYLDRDVLSGVTYYYTLIGDVPTGVSDEIQDEYPLELLGDFPQLRYATVNAGSEQPEILTASYGVDPFLGEQDPFDLSYSQITFRPVGPPPAPLGEPAVGVNYNAYEASTCVVRELPVKRVDAQGGGYTLTPLNPAALLELPLGDMRFPFFGKEYDKVYISVNGYIVFEDFFRALEDYDLSGIDLFDGGDEDEYSIQEILDSPNIAGHFMLPRISFLFSLLRFTDGGQAWGRILSDRLVVTFENAVELFYNPYSSPTRNTVQVELFFSGQIRFTYLDSFVYYGLVGISDGQGAPVDPTGVFDNVEPAFGLTPFVHLPCAPSQLSINPVTPPVVSFGEDAMFTADASTPEGIGLPFFMGQWNNFGEAPFADLGDGSGKFLWATDYEDIGAHTVRVTAQVDNMQAYQDVRVVVQDKVVLPSAVNLLLSTDTLDEDPSVSRPIPPGRPLIASYVYYHPYSEQSPLEYAEGIYMLYWLRNGQVVSALTNSLQVPANIPQPGERWSFQITPITVTMLFGAPADSPVVTVMAVPEIEGITPVQGLTIGGDTVTVRGKYLDDLLFVKFGDVPATSIRIVNDEEVEVITPLHVAGKVTVSVETLSGIGRSIDSFSFVGDQDDPVNEGEGEEEKERRILGCGNSENSGSSKGLDLLLFGIVVFVLLLAARRPRAISDGYCD